MGSSLKVVIVGNGVAGVTAARIIKDRNPQAYVSIYTEETYQYYPRPRLYDVLSGEVEPRAVYLFTETWYKKKGINIQLNSRTSSIDTDRKELLLENGSRISYDKLLIANGGHSFVPPIKGVEKTGVFTLRTIEDALRIKEFTEKTTKVIIIGGGLLGSEFAYSLKKLGQQVDIVEMFPRLLPKQLDPDGATILKNQIESYGINIILGAKTLEILGNKTVTGILLDSGATISADLVLISAGVRPNTGLALESGIKVNRGVVVNEHLRTSDENVYAVGDVAEFNGMIYGIIPAAIEQATVAAANILGDKHSVYSGTVPSNTLRIIGIDLTSMGIVNPEEPKYEEIKKSDQKNGTYKKLVLDKGKIVGAILLGDKKGVTSIKKLMTQQTDITEYKNSILNENFDYTKIPNET